MPNFPDHTFKTRGHGAMTPKQLRDLDALLTQFWIDEHVVDGSSDQQANASATAASVVREVRELQRSRSAAIRAATKARDGLTVPMVNGLRYFAGNRDGGAPNSNTNVALLDRGLITRDRLRPELTDAGREALVKLDGGTG